MAFKAYPDETWPQTRLEEYLLSNDGHRHVARIIRNNPGIRPSEVADRLEQEGTVVSATTVSRAVKALRLLDMLHISIHHEGSTSHRDPKLYMKDRVLSRTYEV